MQITEITLGTVTVCMHWAQLRRILAGVRAEPGTEDTQDIELALESLLLIALISDDLRAGQACANALVEAKNGG